ncbi:hypothetical protein KBB68_00215 [Candidatus Babeliales bacterium]|nr:hypothetical protein [Candidatus Babeliales bacterium]
MNKLSNIFMNSGIRCKAHTGFLEEKNLKILGYTLGYLLAEEFEYSCPILIATDTRPSGNKIKQALIEGLLEFGHNIFDAGICPTPFVAKALKDFQGEDEDLNDSDSRSNSGMTEEDNESFFTLGIVITASHNPAEYNGIKILTPFGYMDIAMEKELTDLFYTFANNSALIDESLPDEAGSIIDFDLQTWYQAELLDSIEKTNSNLSIVLDCANGATAQIAPRIFQTLGYQVIAINNSCDGNKINVNSGCNDQQKLITQVQNNNASWGIAFDGDGDRVIIVDQQGNIFDGDDILVILSQHENYKDSSIVVGTIMTNVGIQKHFEQQGKKLIRTPVGERNLIEALIQHQAFLGSEACGHIIIMDHAFCSDGIFTSLMFLQIVTKNSNLLDRKYAKHFQKHATIPLSHLVISSSKQEFNSFVKNLIQKFEHAYQARCIVRPSNTEPILRIMIEDTDEQNAEKILKELLEELKKETKKMDPRLREDEERE